MKYKILPILIALFNFTLTQAQDYDLKNYKYRVNGYKALSLNSDLRGYSYTSFGSPTNTHSTNNLSLNVDYSRFKNTERHIKNVNYWIISSGSLNNSNFENNSRAFQISNAAFNMEDYFYKGNSFLVSRVSVNGNYNISEVDPTKPIQKQSNSFISGKYEIGYGKGRLEYISDPALANFILKDMQKKGVINSYSPEQVERFGKKISQVLSIRMIDYRFRLIDQITMLDSFLSNEITNQKSSANYFTTLYDNWLYANRFQRFSGKRKEILIGNKSSDLFYKSKFSSDSISRSNFLYNTLFIAFQYSNENPVRLSFQRSRIFRAELQRLDYWANYSGFYFPNSNTRNTFSQIALSYNEAFNWYPNTRTYLSTGVRTSLEYQFKASEVFAGKFNTQYTTNLRASVSPHINLYYFISPKIRVSAYASLSFSYYDYFNPGSRGNFDINNNYGASLAYVFY